MRELLIALLCVSCASHSDPGVCVALTPQTVEVRFRERDGKQSSKLAAQGTVTRAENVVMSKPGAYARRTGTEAVETVSGAKELTAYSGGLVSFSDTVLKQRIGGAFTAPAASSLSWARTTGTRSIETASDQYCHSHVRGQDGRDWHVWEAYEGGVLVVKYSVVDPTTGAHIVHDALVDSGASRPYIIASSTDVLIFYVEGGETNNSAGLASLKVRKIAQASPASVGSAATVENAILQDAADDTFHASFAYDAVASGGIATVASRVLTGGTVKTRVRTWDVATMASIASVDDTTGASTNGDDVIAILQNAANSDYYIAVAYSDTSRVRRAELHIVPVNLASVTIHALLAESNAMPATVLVGWRNITGSVDASANTTVLAETTNHTLIGKASSANTKTTWKLTRSSGGVVATSHIYNLGLASHVWSTSMGTMVMFQRASYVQPTYFVGDVNGVIYGRVFVGEAGAVDNERTVFSTSLLDGGVPNRAGRLPMPRRSGDVATVALLKVRSAPTTHPITGQAPDVGQVNRGAWIATVEPWVAGSEHQPVLAADALLIPGGSPREFDGSRIFPAGGFNSFPEVPSIVGGTNDLPETGDGTVLTAFSAITGTLEDGIYHFQIVAESVNSTGRRIQSAPSIPFDISIAAAPTGVQIRVPNPVGNSTLIENDNLRLVAYRTLKDAGEDAAYYRVAESRVLGGQYTALRIVDGDGTGATSIENNEQLYTDDDTLENIPPPAMRQAKAWKDRVMYLLEENRRAFGWSKLVKPDVGLEFSDAYVFQINDELGDLTALSPLGSNFLLFKRNAVYWISGAGPDDTGVGQFSEPIRLDGVPGTERPRSVVVTDQGVWYQAPDNVVWLISPGLDAKPIGEPCADQTAAVVGAMHVPDKRQVRFHTASTTLVYDTLHGVWTTFTGQASLACCMLGAEAHYLSTGAAVRKDNTSYTESGTTYQAVLELSWLSIAGLAGYQRVWSGDVVGEATGAYSLSVVLGADFGNGTSTKTVASSALAAAFGHRVRFHVPVSLQQKTALRLRLQDDSPTTAGGLWEGINLQCGFAPGRRPQLPSTHRMA